MMMGALDAQTRAVDPADGTCTMVVKLSFQSVTAVSRMRLVAVFGTSRVWVRLWLSERGTFAVRPYLSQLMVLRSSWAPSRTNGVRAGSIGCEKVTLRVPCSVTACWPSASAASLKLAPVTLGAGSVCNGTG